jgi:purine-binding chemotaxis protein CheW
MSSNAGEPAQYLTFTLADSLFAINIAMVREIIPSVAMTKVPMTPVFIRGVLNLRGAVVPVIDMQSRFGWDSAVVTQYTCIVIIDARHSAGPTQLGLMVDSVSEVIEIAASDIEPPPNFGTPVRHDLIEGMAKVDDHFLVILKPSHAFDLEVLTQLVEQEAVA